MKVYLVHSSSYEKVLREAGARILINYATMRAFPVGFKDIIIDSGGYQLQVGVKCKLNDTNRLIRNPSKKLIKDEWVWAKDPTSEAYAMWLTDILPKHPEISGYFNLDIMGDGTSTRRNQKILEEHGLHPIPVWYTFEGEEALKYYYEHYDYIAVGGLASVAAGKDELRSLSAFLGQKYPNNRYHFFGVGCTGASVFQQFRPYSVDFSTWSTPARFGHEIVLDPKTLVKEKHMNKEDRDRLKNDPQYLHDHLIKSIKLFMSLEQEIEKIHTNEKQMLMF